MSHPDTGFAGPGRVWRVGADVDTDQLAPGAYMKFGVDDIARHCLQVLRPDFAKGVTPGDVLVAGPNFGIGSSREQAVSVLLALGVRVVVAPSFNGLYFRNAFNLGLLLLTCAECERLEEGEYVTIDARALGLLRANGTTLRCDPVPDFLLEMIAAGGLVKQLELQLASGALARRAMYP